MLETNHSGAHQYALPPQLHSSLDAVHLRIQSSELSPSTRDGYRRLWRRFVAFVEAEGTSISAPSEELVMGFIVALRVGTAPGSVQSSSGRSLEIARSAISHGLLVAGWADTTTHPALDAFIRGAKSVDAEGTRPRQLPLDVPYVRQLLAARPAPDLFTHRDRFIFWALWATGINLTTLMSVHRGDLMVGDFHVELRIATPGGWKDFYVLRDPDPDVCPVRAMRRLLDALPHADYPLSLVRSVRGGPRTTARTITDDGIKRAANGVRGRLALALRQVGTTQPSVKTVRSLSTDTVRTAARRLDQRLGSALREEAAILLAWRGGLKRSHLRQLRVGESILFEQGGRIVVRRPVPNGQTQEHWVEPARDSELCAVAALARWLRWARLRNGDMLFCAVTTGGSARPEIAMSAGTWGNLWRQMAIERGLNPARFGANSPRAGFIDVTARTHSVPQIVSAIGPEGIAGTVRHHRSVRQRPTARDMGL